MAPIHSSKSYQMRILLNTMQKKRFLKTLLKAKTLSRAAVLIAGKDLIPSRKSQNQSLLMEGNKESRG
jgi:hypothetical protein